MKVRVSRKLWLGALAGFVAGVLWLGAIRFFTLKDDSVHHHANFALYVDGKQDRFDNFTFYEEVASCNSNEADNPKGRVHMHQEVIPNSAVDLYARKPAHVVHAHDNAVTWGHFFANLGYVLGNDFIKTDQGLFISGQNGKKLSFELNGFMMDTVYNLPIKSEDALLINYGSEDTTTLQSRYEAIPKDAHDFNEKTDPASCAGSQPLNFGQRLKKAFIN